VSPHPPRSEPSPPGPAPRPQGRPRDPAVDKRIRRAALEVLAEGGFSRFSVDAVCLRAGVPRSTFYRRWAGALEMVVDAFDDAARIDPLPDTGDLLDDLVSYARRLGSLFADPIFRACMNYISAEAALRPDLRQRLIADWTLRRAKNRELFQRALARGEASAEIDPDLVFDIINGLAMTTGGIIRAVGDADYELVLGRLLRRRAR
jgi:AcrR family transcriptional regulator